MAARGIHLPVYKGCIRNFQSLVDTLTKYCGYFMRIQYEKIWPKLLQSCDNGGWIHSVFFSKALISGEFRDISWTPKCRKNVKLFLGGWFSALHPRSLSNWYTYNRTAFKDSCAFISIYWYNPQCRLKSGFPFHGLQGKDSWGQPIWEIFVELDHVPKYGWKWKSLKPPPSFLSKHAMNKVLLDFVATRLFEGVL